MRMCNVMHTMHRCILSVCSADVLCHRHCEKALSTHMQHYIIVFTTYGALCTSALVNPRHMRSEGYGSLSVCLSVYLSMLCSPLGRFCCYTTRALNCTTLSVHVAQGCALDDLNGGYLLAKMEQNCIKYSISAHFMLR